jgi:hypothetical protein
MSSVPNKAPNLLAASGAITPVDGQAQNITKAGIAALTLALPTEDGIRFAVIDETGYDHVILVGGSPPSGLNAAHGTLTFNGTAGSSVELLSRNGRWWTVNLNGVTVS